MTANPLHPDEQELIDIATFGIEMEDYLFYRSEGHRRNVTVMWFADWLGAYGYDGQLHMDGPDVLVLENNGVTLRLALHPEDLEEASAFNRLVSHWYWAPLEFNVEHPAEHLRVPVPASEGYSEEPF